MNNFEHFLIEDPNLVGTCDGVEGWAAKIKERVARGTVHVLDLARLIHSAKAALHRGQWSKLLQLGRLPFSKRKAEMLAVVGRCLGGLNAQTSAHLPSGWNTLYYLARLPLSLLASLIADGTVHQSLRLAEARSLYAQFKGVRANSGNRLSVRRRFQRFFKFLRASSATWTAADRQFVRCELQNLATELAEPHPRPDRQRSFFCSPTNV